MPDERTDLFAHIQVDPEELLGDARISVTGDACAFLGGSLAEGLGNRSSDLDGYVFVPSLGDRTFDYFSDGAHSNSGYHGARRYAFQFWTFERIRLMADDLRALTFEANRPGLVPLVERMPNMNVEVAHRIRVGLPLFSPALLAEVRSWFDYAKLARFLTLSVMADIDRYHEDVCGTLDAGDLDTGPIVARSLIDVCCDAYLHQRGNTNSSRKWRSRLLSRLEDAPAQALRARYLRLQFPRRSAMASDPQVFRAYMEACLRFSDDVYARLEV